MRIAKLIISLFCITCLLSCSVDNKTKANESLESKSSELIELERRLKGLETPLEQLVIYGRDIDDAIIQTVLLEYMKVGSGFDVLTNYTFDLEIGKIDVETCKIFALGMIDGAWSISYENSITKGTHPIGNLRLLVYLYRSLETDYPDIANDLLNHHFALIDNIENPTIRASRSIIVCNELYLSGFGGMDVRIIDSINLFIKSSSNQKGKFKTLEIISKVAEISSVDYKNSLMFSAYFLDDEYYVTECKSAIATGLMKSDYERGRTLFVEASREIVEFEFNPDAKSHTPFELAYSNLKENDKKKYAGLFFDVMNHYKRTRILPPIDKSMINTGEPELPSWYREQLFEWLSVNHSTSKRVDLMLIELAKHCSRYPKSNNTEIFIGWLLDWIDDLETPLEKYLALGKLVTTQNAVIPNNISIARTRIERIISGLKSKLPEMDINDSLFSVAFFKEPANFKRNLGGQSDISGNLEFLIRFINIMQYRHHFFPDDDAGLADIATELAKGIEQKSYSMANIALNKGLSAMWAGWNNDKAWQMITSIDYTSGEFPSLMAALAYETKSYAPGFSARCFEKLNNSYENWEFDLSNPAMELSLVKSLSSLSIQSAEKLADIIIEHRGENDPAFSFYKLNSTILKRAFELNEVDRELARLTSEIQDKLREDFKVEN